MIQTIEASPDETYDIELEHSLLEANAKLANLVTRFDSLMKEASDSGRTIANAERMRIEVKDIQQALFRRSVGD